MVATTIRVPDKLWRQFRILALSKGMTANELVARVLKEYLEASRQEPAEASSKPESTTTEPVQEPTEPAQAPVTPAEKKEPG